MPGPEDEEWFSTPGDFGKNLKKFLGRGLGRWFRWGWPGVEENPRALLESDPEELGKEPPQE
ncbi:MAG: hypothetical protein ABSC00_02995 [Acidimicrobiales bacterium]|jgi:hypothetical protein